MKKLSLALIFAIGACLTSLNAQTYKATYATKLFLSGGGSPINPLTIQSPILGSPYTLTLPGDAGTSGYLLQTDGSGNLSWVTPPSGTVTRNATLTGNGSSGSPLGINLGNANTWTANQTFAGTFLIASNSRIALTNSDNNPRDIRWQEPSGTGTQYIGLRAPSVSNNGNYVFPAVVGTAGQVLSLATSNGVDSATMQWITVSSGGTVTTNATLSGDGSVGTPLGINLGNSNTWTANQTFAGTFLITSNSRIAMTNSDNNARDIRLQEPSGTGSQYIGLRAPSVSNNGNYVLPAVVGSVGQALTIASTNGIDSATMQWSTISGGGGGTLSNYVHKVTSVTTTYTAATTDDIIGVDNSSGSGFTLTLPSAASAGAGKIIIFKNESSNTTGGFTANRSGTDLIDGATSKSSVLGYGSLRFYSDGSGGWWTF